MWAGHLWHEWADAGVAESPTDLLGAGAHVETGAGYAIGVRPGGPDDARLDRGDDGRIRVTVAVNGERTTVATLDPGPPHPLLTLTPDPFGLHDCFFNIEESRRWFASNPALFPTPSGIRSSVNSSALHGYLCFSYVPAPWTLVGSAYRVPAGGRWIASAAGFRLEPGAPWREGDRTRLTEDEAARELDRLLQDTVTRRLDGEQEVGVFLSGGLDSSLIAALLVAAGARVKLFTLDFGPPHDVELVHARRVAEHLGQPLHVVPAGAREVRSALRATASALREPFGDSVTVPLTLLGKAAAEHVGIVFNGEGGDQLFGGWANKPMVAAHLYGNRDFDRIAAYLATFHRFHGQTERLYTKEARAEMVTADARAWLEQSLAGGAFGSLLHWLRAANLRMKGAQNIAPRAVQLASAHGLTVRMPFFDQALAEWSFSLPPEWLLQGACEKALLKRVAAAYLPAEIVAREKRGMGVPVSDWLRGPLRRDVGRVLNPWRVRRDGWFEPAAVASLRRGEDREGEFRGRRAAERLWALLMLHLWVDVHPRARFRW